MSQTEYKIAQQKDSDIEDSLSELRNGSRNSTFKTFWLPIQITLSLVELQSEGIS